jgi:hypothetical protein
MNRVEPSIHTAGCNFVEIFGTPGCRQCSRAYSRQYHLIQRDGPGEFVPVPKDYPAGGVAKHTLSALRSLLLGTKRSEYGRYLVVGAAFGAFVITFVAYGLGIFSVSMGLVWIPFHAAIVGMIAGCWVGYSRGGAVLAWIVTYTSLLGYRANR